jgi:hypothetical protein
LFPQKFICAFKKYPKWRKSYLIWSPWWGFNSKPLMNTNIMIAVMIPHPTLKTIIKSS